MLQAVLQPDDLCVYVRVLKWCINIYLHNAKLVVEWMQIFKRQKCVRDVAKAWYPFQENKMKEKMYKKKIVHKTKEIKDSYFSMHFEVHSLVVAYMC